MKEGEHELGEVKANAMRVKGRRKRSGSLADHANHDGIRTGEEEDGQLALTLSQERQSDLFGDEENKVERWPGGIESRSDQRGGTSVVELSRDNGGLWQ